MANDGIPDNLERALRKLESTAGALPTVIKPGNLQHKIRQLRQAIEDQMARGDWGSERMKRIERTVLEIENATAVLIVGEIDRVTNLIRQGLL